MGRWKMRGLAALVLSLLCLAAAVGYASAGSEPRAYGNGATAFQDFSFNARGTPEDATGNVVAHIPLGFEGVEFRPDLLVHGRVECLNVVGNVAVMTGPVLKTQHVPEILEPFDSFDRFYVVVQDNGKRQGANADRWNGTFYKRGQLPPEEEALLEDCTIVGPVGNPLVKGDLTVVPAVP
jgi:hypothetical protein